MYFVNYHLSFTIQTNKGSKGKRWSTEI